ncbi:ATP-dependent nuclease [Thiohalorhabdus sp. Cl-TMA]|uniref:ATP-dependent endonuclease n=1 Tax=Thiohalorhabdus methylotrophus TaxID=3242694 RepID=A0ABV4TPY6_9GAMM
MKIERVSLTNFRSFGPGSTVIDFERAVTCLIGSNGAGKTAAFLALSRIFGTGSNQRKVRRQDFHIPAATEELESGASLGVEVVLGFPELDGEEDEDVADAVPEFFRQMAASGPGESLKCRLALRATWTDDGTPEGNVDEELRWITTLGDDFEWSECPQVQAVERGSIQLVYLPASRDAATQVTALLKGRLWQAARWSDNFRECSTQSANDLQNGFEREAPTEFIIHRLNRRWQEVHEGDTDTTPRLRLVENRPEELVRKAEFSFYPDEAGQERALSDLSDGQRSLFHIALTAATLEAERDSLSSGQDESPFEQEKLRRAHLTLLAIEEPENSLSPFFLSRIMRQARDLGEMPSAQVALSSHSPAILSRLEPEEIRHFRLDQPLRSTSARKLALPSDDQEASQYIRLAVQAYPEIYFARFVILGEGDSERFIIPRVAEAMGIPLDPSFVPVVPLGGRYVTYFWNLLSDLGIPFATLLDLDLGRAHGGVATLHDVISKLTEAGQDFGENPFVLAGEIDPENIKDLDPEELLEDYENSPWLKALAQEGVYFSSPLDIDFSMLSAFPTAYMQPRPGGRGPRGQPDDIQNKKAVSLKTSGNPNLYPPDYDDHFKWYPYLFLGHSKPEGHVAALSRINAQSLAQNAPPELRAIIKYAGRKIGLWEDEE